jgi:ketosteroid isomerase-like protein
MKKAGWIFSVVWLGCATPRVADPPPPPSPEVGLAVSQLLELEHARARAVSEGDVFTVEAELSDSYRGFTWDGQQRTKTQELAHLRSEASETRTTLQLAADELEVSAYGPFAIVTGRGNLERVRRDERDFRQVRFTHVWMWRDGQWQMVSAHESVVGHPSSMPPPKSPRL